MKTSDKKFFITFPAFVSDLRYHYLVLTGGVTKHDTLEQLRDLNLQRIVANIYLEDDFQKDLYKDGEVSLEKVLEVYDKFRASE
jgi:hypothetical protein